MYRKLGKRVLDCLGAAFGLVILSPLLGLIALAIYLEDRGTVIFRQARVGRCGLPFVLLKFRSMPVDTKPLPSDRAVRLRVTHIGRIIRRTNLDELPQLWNVIRGDMSIIGPRPALPQQERLCELRRERDVLKASPGLTGLAQVNAYDGMSDLEKADWDERYCQNLSFSRDVLIVLRTFAYFSKRPPVY